MSKRSSILRPASFLVLATVALIIFIAVTGDSRRQANAIHRARAYAGRLGERIGAGKRLPLNLSLREPSASDSGLVEMESLSSADAYILRNSSRKILAAWTAPVVRAMGADGRASIFFHEGAFSVRWLTLNEFERNRAEQGVWVDELRPEKARP